ncbi:MAG: polymer-forming cytoskeletal protein [Elusimicrobiales bacterium]|nr:polymer-forming cytoskeletal protein [Elusimicrobiales bacterium]
MAMFKNTNISFESKNGDTVIGTEAYFQGTLTAKGSLRVDGRIDGSIVDAKIVTVGKTGKVKGDISCEICYVSGEVRGNVTALDHIEALAGSRIDGDMRSPRIMLEEGAVFNGNCTMDAPKKPADQPQQKNSKTEAKQP